MRLWSGLIWLRIQLWNVVDTGTKFWDQQKEANVFTSRTNISF
jgi:hypothetical protein